MKKLVRKTAKKPVGKAVGRPVRKTAKKVADKAAKGSAKKPPLMSDVTRKFAKANGLPQTYASMLLLGYVFSVAMEKALEVEVKAGRDVDDVRAEWRDLKRSIKQNFSKGPMSKLKVKPSEIPEIAEMIKQYESELAGLAVGAGKKRRR